MNKMSGTPLITIVTPVYNSADYLEETMLSVINQTYKNIQYILVDGNSTDGSINIIKKFSSRINCFISEKDKGMYDAISKGFSLGKGKYFAWINSDDLYFNNAIEKAISIMEKNKFEMIIGAPTILNLNKKIIYRHCYHYPNWIVANSLATPCFWGFIPQESTIFTKELYNKCGGFNKNLKYAGDFDLWRKFAKKTKLNSVKIRIGIFRKRNGQLSENYHEYYREINKIKCFFPIGKLFRLIYSIIKNILKNK
jgi:glycosyltransferase involved in cell wall biosynthesis